MALQHPAFLNCLSVVDKASVGNNSVGKSVVDGVDGSSVDGVGNNGSVDSVGNDRGVVDSVGNGDGGSGNVATSRGRGVDGLTGVGDLSDVSGQVVGVVGDGLDPAVGKVDGVRSSHGTSAIVGLRLLEVGLGVVVGHGVGVGVGGGLGEVGGGNGVGHGVDSVGHNGGSVHHRVGNGVGNGVGNTVGSKKLGGGRGRSHKGKGDEGLEVVISRGEFH